MKKRKIANSGKYYASVTGAKDDTNNNFLMVFFDTEDRQGNDMGTTILFVNDNFEHHPTRADHKFLNIIGVSQQIKIVYYRRFAAN